jgi:hypothetical protein
LLVDAENRVAGRMLVLERNKPQKENVYACGLLSARVETRSIGEEKTSTLRTRPRAFHETGTKFRSKENSNMRTPRRHQFDR